MSEILLIKLFFSVRDKLPKISFEYKCILSKGRFKWNYLTLKSDFDRSREKLLAHVKNHWEIVFAEQQIYCA